MATRKRLKRRRKHPPDDAKMPQSRASIFLFFERLDGDLSSSIHIVAVNQKALDLEKKERKLDKEQWFALITNLATVFDS